MGAPPAENHRGAFLDEAFDGAPADAAGAAGNNGDLALKPHDVPLVTIPSAIKHDRWYNQYSGMFGGVPPKGKLKTGLWLLSGGVEFGAVEIGVAEVGIGQVGAFQIGAT